MLKNVSVVYSVLNWDLSALKKRASNLERGNILNSKVGLETIRAYCQKPALDQMKVREHCRKFPDPLTAIGEVVLSCVIAGQEQCSIIRSIFVDHSEIEHVSQEEHAKALEYLAIQLSMADRKRLIDTLCNHRPDHLTTSIRYLVTAYEPIIRILHKAVDLSETVYDFQLFLTDMIDLSKLEQASGCDERMLPTVEDFCQLLRKHAHSAHKFLHQMLKNSSELKRLYQGYAHMALSQYRRHDKADAVIHGGGGFSAELINLYNGLSVHDKTTVLEELSDYAAYLSKLKENYWEKMQAVVRNYSNGTKGSMLGPGLYLPKWQRLIDETPIAPELLNGPLRTGKTESVQQATRVAVDGDKKGSPAGQVNVGLFTSVALPRCSETIRLLAPTFRQKVVKITER